MIEVIIADEAERELSDIIRYISIDNPVRAETFVEELLNKSIDIRHYWKYLWISAVTH